MNRLRALVALAAILVSLATAWGADDFKFHVYGRIRSDLFYNSRDNVESVDGLYYMYPKDHLYDPLGHDLNGTSQGSFYSIYTRLGLDITGPKLGTAATSAKVEIDFRGSGTDYALPRIRHAYFALLWRDRWQLLVGQTWHPLFGEVAPNVLSLSTGVPFQPFNRSPQIRGRLTTAAGWQVTAAAVWQMQNTSIGPDGKSRDYLKNSCVPEMYLGADFNHGPWTVGAGGEMLSLKPRTQATIDNVTYSVDERVTSLSAVAHLRYRTPMLTGSARTTLANNLTHMSMLGGFGVIDTNPVTGECQYTPFRHSMTWVNLVYGQRWQPGLFVGYLKNLGTRHPITGPTYGEGLDVDQMLGINAQFTFNLPNWKFGIEGSTSTCWYGTPRLADGPADINHPTDGRVVDTHPITNLRLTATAQFIF